MRAYQQTHPWLRFTLSLAGAPERLWMLLGECRSKCDSILAAALPVETARELSDEFIAEGCIAVSGVDSDVLADAKPREILDNTFDCPESQVNTARRVRNIVKEIRGLDNLAGRGDLPKLSIERFGEVNRAVLDGLPTAEGVVPGELRESYAGSPSPGAPLAEDCEYLLQRLCAWLRSDTAAAGANEAIVHGIMKAALAHLYIMWICPFGDGNARTAKLMEAQMLMAAGVPAVAALLVAEHYQNTKSDYQRCIDEATRSEAGVLGFVSYALLGFRDGLDRFLDALRRRQRDVIWRACVRESFKGRSATVAARRERLILALSDVDEPVQTSELPSLDPHLVELYAKRSRLTLTRDVKALIEMGLAERTQNGIQALRESVISFQSN